MLLNQHAQLPLREVLPVVDVLNKLEAGADDGGRGEFPRAGKAHPPFAKPGRMVGDRYRLDALLATGGMGEVWRGLDLVLGRPVAVKVLRRERIGDAAALSRFRAEARLSAGLTHPNIAALHDYGEVEAAPGRRDERLAYLVMELVEGEALSTVLRRERRLTPRRTLEIMRQTAAGLAAAHAAGVVHRDVKPGNLMLGPGDTVTITDFGIAWTESSDPLTRTGQVLGTAQYLSPEQASGAKAGPASDVYALGIVAYECLAGRRAYEGESPLQIALKHINQTPEPLPADVPSEVRQLVERVLVKDPAERYPDGAALLTAVEDVLAGRALSPQRDRHATTVLPVADLRSEPEPATPQPGKSGTSVGPRHAASGRRPSRRILIPLIALLLLAAVVTGAFVQNDGGSSVPPVVAPSTPTVAPTVDVNAGDYLGRPVAEVQADLIGLGLTVQLRPIQTADATDGEVLAVEPVGRLSPGALVTVTPAVAPPPAPVEEEGRDAGGAGSGDSGLPTSASETTSASPTAPAPDNNGNGNGRGKGRGNG
jgi:eukaryotic-like serine/threonine-protein kinase